jgi:cell division protein FtsI (penicillin-binding protein 3)
VVNVRKTINDLVSILQIDREELRKRLKSRRSFEWIQRQISPKESAEIKAFHFPGIYFLKENRRFYPNSQLAAHLIGFVGLDSKGLEGVEFRYDTFLNGGNEVWIMGRDALGRKIVTGEALAENKDQPRNIFLTLGKHIQHVVETELGWAVQKWGAKGGIAIAMEPQTGKVLAMASYPSFNPNQFIQYQPKIWRNQAISDAFEPGSLFKTFLAATVLEEGLVKPSDSFFCGNGSYTVYDRTIHDHMKHGWLTFQQIIKFSSNIGASKMGEKIGKERLYRYICAFGFAEKTRIDLPGEAKGIVHHPRYWPPVALDTISFGQGISVTGIQMVTALSAIANGGFLMKPYVVEKITDEKGEVRQFFQPEIVRRVISGGTAKKVTALLKAATEKGGTGEEAVPAGYEVAGKTGTAQKIEPLLGGYSEDRFHSSFMGFAPAENPKIVLLVVIDEPQGKSYGGIVAAPLFKAIMEKVLPYLNVYPKGTQIVKKDLHAVPDEGTPGGGILTREAKVLQEVERVVMPDLTGLSMRNALNRIEGKGLIIKVSGNGKVVEQNPKAGTLVEKGDICYLKFQSPS